MEADIANRKALLIWGIKFLISGVVLLIVGVSYSWAAVCAGAPLVLSVRCYIWFHDSGVVKGREAKIVKDKVKDDADSG